MSVNPLAVLNSEMQLPAEFQKQMNLGGFIPNIQLLQPLSDIVQNPPRDLPTPPKPGHFFFSSNIDLGGQYDCVPIAAMMHALSIRDKKMDCESFDHTSSNFQRIMADEGNRKSLPSGLVPRWGVDVLLFLPALKKYGIYFLYSTARNIAKDFTDNAGKLLTVKAKILKNKTGQSWWSPDPFVNGVPDSDVVADLGDPTDHISKFKSRKPRDAAADAVAAATKPGSANKAR